MNPFNLKPHSQKYKDIFKTRQGLPVHKQMGEFLEMFNSVSNLTLPPPPQPTFQPESQSSMRLKQFC